MDLEAGQEVSSARGNQLLVLLVATTLVGAAGAYLILPSELANFVVLICLGLLATIGVVALIAAAGGLVTVTGGGDTLNESVLDQCAFFASMDEGALISDRSGRPLAANPAYRSLAGSDAGELISVEHLLSGNPDASDAVFRLSTSAEQGRRAAEEIRMPAGLDGKSAGARWFRLRVNPLSRSTIDSEFGGDWATRASEPRVGWMIADITREREHQENIFQELQNAIDYLDHAPAGFFSLDPDGRVRYINATLAEWVGIDLAIFEPGATHIGDFVSVESVPVLEAAAKSGAGASPLRMDIDLVKTDGTLLPVSLLHRVPVSADGSIGASRTIVIADRGDHDVESGRMAEIRFNRFFNNSPIAIAAIDEKGQIGLTNARFLLLFGDEAGGVANKHLPDCVNDVGRAALSAAIDAAVAGQDDIPAVDAAFAQDLDRSARFFISPILERDDGGDVAIVYAMETTEQRALEAQFAQSQKMQAVGQLAGGIAHDFNNVLTAIIGFSDLLLSTHRPSDPSFQDIMNIKQNANRAAGLVRQLLAFSRRQTLRPKVIEFGDVLSDLSVLLDRLLGEKVNLVVEHGRGLWPIKADLNQLEQVIVNLAVNARDAMPDGGTLTIKTDNLTHADSEGYAERGFKPADYVTINVSDTGTGMPPDVLEKVFEPFFSTKDVGKGTGLGLSTVYGIVKQTGGYIYVDSEPDIGTSFRVLLPRHIPIEGERGDEEGETIVAAPSDLTGNATILLVEDEEAVRAFAARALSARGYEVHEAATGTEALEVIKAMDKPVDLVVSDVVMPEMDGPTLLSVLRRTQPDLKIIFVSGYAEEAFAKHLPEDESFHFLPKPFSLKELAVAVKQTLDG